MASVKKIIEHAQTQCEHRGTRLTDKRKAVLTGLLSSRQALSAYELIDVCRETLDEKLPPMSMYRILDFLEKEQLVHKLKLANRYVACTHITCNHQHEVPQFLICSECYRVEETAISKAMLDSLKGNVKKVGFELVSPQLEINCVCGDCR
ncbi:MAG: Fur family zinc uptake transcriptional regulator [Porticoccaceae bacterium]